MATPRKAPADCKPRGGHNRKPPEERSVRLNATTVPQDIAEAIREAGGVRAVIQQWYDRQR